MGKKIQTEISEEAGRIFDSRKKGIQQGFLLEEALFYLHNSRKFGPLYFDKKSEKKEERSVKEEKKQVERTSEIDKIKEW
jgi:hypothetical protein